MAASIVRKLFESIDILFSGILIVFLQSGSFKAFGVLFDDIVTEYDTSNTYAGWILTLQASASFIIAGISGSLLEGFQNRTIGVFGGFFFGLGFVLTGLLSHDVYQLFILTGVTAIGGGLLYISLLMTFLEHFDEEVFPVAYSVRELFQYLGITIVPVVVDKLRTAYGLHGSYLIIGALLWNCVISGVLMKPKRSLPRPPAGVKVNHLADRPTKQSNLSGPEIVPTNRKSLSKVISCSILDLCSIAPAVKHPPFALYLMVHSLFSYSFAVWAIFLVPFGTSVGLRPNVAVLLSAAGGIGGFLGKVMVLVVFWYNRMNAITSSVFPAVLCILSLFGYILFDDFWKLAIASIFCGFSLAYADAALNGLLPRYLCNFHLRQGAAMSYIYSGSLMQIGGVVSGVLLDTTGSFSMVFGIVLTLNILSIALAICMHKMDGIKAEC